MQSYNVNFYLIESLEECSSLDVDWTRLDYINENWNEFTEMEYYDLIQKLKDNELDPVTQGRNYNQTDIRNHLKKLK
jgi:hypothetical protein